MANKYAMWKQATYSGGGDQVRMLALAKVALATNLHIVDWTYRLASWAFDYPDNVALWMNEAGELMAWAVLQTPFWAIDYVMHPEAESSGLHQHILSWADERAQLSLDTRAGRPAWFVNVFAQQTARMSDLERAGFANQAGVGEDSWSKVLMMREASQPLVDVRMSEGFTVRPLSGDSEVDAYAKLHRAVFESESMTVEWRQRTLQQPAYKPELDLVLEAPDRSLAGFCVCWLDGDRGQIEPMGIRADVRGRRLGKVLLTEGLRRLREHGARHVFVETDNYRNAALSLYESVGFRVLKDVFVFRKDYAS